MGLIYWIASYPKSGNTWTRAFLTALITGGLFDDLDRLKKVAPDENSGRYYRRYMTKPLPEASDVEIAQARPKAHRAMAKEANGFLFLKTHAMVARHHGTPTITLDVTAGAIYLIRNPLDVAVSYSDFRDRSVDRTIQLMHQSGRVLDRPKDAAYEAVGSWSEHVASWTRPNDRVHIMRYEDMLADSLKMFSGLVQFLRMDVSPERVAKAVAESSFDNLRSVEEATGFSERPTETGRFFRSGKVGEWRDRLTEEQVARIVTTNEVGMRRFGYWLDEFDDLVSKPSAAATGSSSR